MPDKAWKNRERLVARFFGGVRNALSGINSKVTHSDVVHDSLFIECKLRAKHTAIKLWDDTKVLADKEKKTPVIALCEKNRPGFWIMVHSDDFEKVSGEIDINYLLVAQAGHDRPARRRHTSKSEINDVVVV